VEEIEKLLLLFTITLVWRRGKEGGRKVPESARGRREGEGIIPPFEHAFAGIGRGEGGNLWSAGSGRRIGNEKIRSSFLCLSSGQREGTIKRITTRVGEEGGERYDLPRSSARVE